MKKRILILFFTVAFFNSSFAQVCWISGPPIIGEGTGVHADESPILALQDIMVDTFISSSAKYFLEDLKFKIQFNKSSVGFFTKFRTGQHYTNCTIKFWYQRPDATEHVLVTLFLQDVAISGFKILAPECNNNPSCNVPLLEISLNWRKMTLTDDFGNSSTLDKAQIGL